MTKDAFSPPGQVDPAGPQHTLCLEDSSMVINPNVLIEALVLEPAIGIFGSPVSSKVSPHYWEDQEITACAPEIFSILPGALNSLLISLRLRG